MSTGYINYKKAPYQVRIVSYRCERCFRKWQSANGSLSDYQLCKNCLQKCYPGTYKWQAPNKKGNQNPETFVAHNTELCGKCIRLGFSCMELGVNEDEDKGGIVVNNIEGDEVTLEHTNLSNYIRITEKAPLKSKKSQKKPEQVTNSNQETPGRRKSVDKKAQRLKEKQEWLKLYDDGKNKKGDKKAADDIKIHATTFNEPNKDDIKIEANVENRDSGEDEITTDNSNIKKKIPTDTSNEANNDVEKNSVNFLIKESVIHGSVIDNDTNDIVNALNILCNLFIVESNIDYAANDTEGSCNSTYSIDMEKELEKNTEKAVEHLVISEKLVLNDDSSTQI
ncbi:hypothetical protein BD770DRAFT_473156 [Pilaira anomala]|nr:hypothetical protein BD770DRAFT_473156 [Pilaira anomala]